MSNYFVVWKDDGSCRRFTPGPRGLYYCDMSSIVGTVLTNYCYNAVDNIAPEMVNTVKENLKLFNHRQVVSAKLARQLQDTAGLTTTSLLRMLDCNGLKNCPVSREAVANAIKIWGPSKANLQGKTTRSSEEAVIVNAETVRPVPPEIMEAHSDVSIGMDIMKVNEIPFLVTISTVLHYAAFFELANLKIETPSEAIKTMTKIYRSRGFKIVGIAADNGFAALKNNETFTNLGIPINIISEDEHEPFSERLIWPIKERCRMIFSTVPFT